MLRIIPVPPQRWPRVGPGRPFAARIPSIRFDLGRRKLPVPRRRRDPAASRDVATLWRDRAAGTRVDHRRVLTAPAGRTFCPIAAESSSLPSN